MNGIKMNFKKILLFFIIFYNFNYNFYNFFRFFNIISDKNTINVNDKQLDKLFIYNDNLYYESLKKKFYENYSKEYQLTDKEIRYLNKLNDKSKIYFLLYRYNDKLKNYIDILYNPDKNQKIQKIKNND